MTWISIVIHMFCFVCKMNRYHLQRHPGLLLSEAQLMIRVLKDGQWDITNESDIFGIKFCFFWVGIHSEFLQTLHTFQCCLCRNCWGGNIIALNHLMVIVAQRTPAGLQHKVIKASSTFLLLLKLFLVTFLTHCKSKGKFIHFLDCSFFSH